MDSTARSSKRRRYSPTRPARTDFPINCKEPQDDSHSWNNLHDCAASRTRLAFASHSFNRKDIGIRLAQKPPSCHPVPRYALIQGRTSHRENQTRWVWFRPAFPCILQFPSCARLGLGPMTPCTRFARRILSLPRGVPTESGAPHSLSSPMRKVRTTRSECR